MLKIQPYSHHLIHPTSLLISSSLSRLCDLSYSLQLFPVKVHLIFPCVLNASFVTSSIWLTLWREDLHKLWRLSACSILRVAIFRSQVHFTFTVTFTISRNSCFGQKSYFHFYAVCIRVNTKAFAFKGSYYLTACQSHSFDNKIIIRSDIYFNCITVAFWITTRIANTVVVAKSCSLS